MKKAPYIFSMVETFLISLWLVAERFVGQNTPLIVPMPPLPRVHHFPVLSSLTIQMRD